MREDADTRPLLMAAAMLLLALAGMSFPTDWMEGLLGALLPAALIRYVFGAVGIIFIIMFGFNKYLGIGKSSFSGFDLMLLGLVVVLNNFPYIALIQGGAEYIATGNILVRYLVYCLSIGFFEEIFFRGLIFPLLFLYFRGKKHGTLLSVLVSSAVFGLVHLINLFGGASFGAVAMQIGYSFLIGAMCAVVFLFTRCIWWAVILHGVFDIGGLMSAQGLIKGEIWSIAAIIVTIIVAVLVVAYYAFRFFRAEKKRQFMFFIPALPAQKSAPEPEKNED